MTSSGEPFPAADLEKELHPGSNKEFEVDSVSSAVDANKQIKRLDPDYDQSGPVTPSYMQEQRDVVERKEQERKDALQSFKKAIIVSGITVAVVGALFAITKKIREK
ncbi:uncharacterized protein LOC130996657 isoform X1 [Salvia miltiorrhiza]|uniref:uncharacterized protein LOC130996657 isoform X1 n=1 Tax=Salvia miltiorrhiza TaxID=226208 RepID=UPI0025AD2C4D|nr:uncharacterized protein LOC130996657 isoform X1 [Salvia miltiorrhiza]